MDLYRVLHSMLQHGASDLHLQVDSPPAVRVHGQLSTLQLEAPTSEDLESTLAQISDDQVREVIGVPLFRQHVASVVP